MNDRRTESERLHELLSRAVDDIEPAERLDDIRNRTKVTTMSSRRPWIYGAGGAVVATAAVITAIAFAGNLTGDDDGQEAGPADSTSPSAETEASDDAEVDPDTDAPTTEQNGGGEAAVPVYYLGDGSGGVKLFREFRHLRLQNPDDRLTPAVTTAVSATPQDPDYRNPWPEGTGVASAEFTDGTITVDLISGGNDLTAASGLSADEAKLAVQQLVYTAQAGVGQGRKPVQLLVDGEQVDTVLGQPAAQPMKNQSPLDVLNLMTITSPGEGAEVNGKFTATGANNGPEANVLWEILKDGEVVKKGFGTANGWMGEQLYAWKVNINASDLAPGEYTLRASNDDPTGGAEGPGAAEDTKTFVIK